MPWNTESSCNWELKDMFHIGWIWDVFLRINSVEVYGKAISKVRLLGQGKLYKMPCYHVILQPVCHVVFHHSNRKWRPMRSVSDSIATLYSNIIFKKGDLQASSIGKKKKEEIAEMEMEMGGKDYQWLGCMSENLYKSSCTRVCHWVFSIIHGGICDIKEDASGGNERRSGHREYS